MSRIKKGSSINEDLIEQKQENLISQPFQQFQETPQEKLLHLKTILMLCQLNTSMSVLDLKLDMTFCKLEDRILSRKLWAFENLSLFEREKIRQIPIKSHLEKSLAQRMHHESASIIQSIESEEESNFSETAQQQRFCFETENQRSMRIQEKCKNAFNKMHDILKLKTDRIIAYSFYKLGIFCKIHKRKSQNQNYASISIQNQKNKIFRRGNDKINRKSFSLEKPDAQFKNQQKYIASKQNPTKNIYSHSSKNSKQKQETNVETNESVSLKTFQNYPSALIPKPKINLQIYPTKKRTASIRQRKVLKSGSNSKLPSSININEKLQKQCEFNYLKRKYEKMIGEFSQFSQKFLKIVQQQQDYAS